MGVLRSLLLAASQNRWLSERAPKLKFVRRAVSRFMPGEDLEDALAAATTLDQQGLLTLFTRLGENVSDPAEAAAVSDHYIHALDRIRELGLRGEVSVKLTHLGLDLSVKECYANFECIARHNGANGVVWIDMESSVYVDKTLEIYRRARAAGLSVGVCLQAYLYRTADDLASLVPLGGAIRLVKGAYREPPNVAFPKKKDVDRNFFELAAHLLGAEAQRAGVRTAIATHDLALIRRVEEYAVANKSDRSLFEFAMLYGIQSAEQIRLARAGWRSATLIAYGAHWFPWYMRRLAERPANVWFVVRKLITA